MRHVVLALMLLLGLTPAAAAAPLGAASGLMLGQAPPLARGAVPAVGAPDNDFGIEGAEPRLPDAPARRDRPAMSSNQAPADRGLSFDVEIRPRSRFGDLARKDDVEDPSLGDQLGKLIERPVFGLRGRYRF